MVLTMNRWIGKVAVVTGASVGLGANFADRLVVEGLQVVGMARRVELIQKRSQELQSQGSKGKLHAVKADLTKEKDILKAFQWIANNLGPIHILINNAGVFPVNTLAQGNTEAWKLTLDVNVLALCICTREAIKSMEENKINGHIVHVNSRAGHYVPNLPGINIYSASKHAVTALTETLRQELNRKQSKIKITSLSPGLVATEMTTLDETKWPKDMLELMKQQPILQSEDITDGLLYVLSTAEHVQVHELIIGPLGEVL